MSGQLKMHQLHHGTTTSEVVEEKRRSVWRQKLVEAERGFTLGFRGDSSFFVLFFTGSLFVTSGLVLGISLLEWSILVMSLTVVLTAEMFHSVLKAILHSIEHHFPQPARQALNIGAAAVLLSRIGSTVAIGLIFGQRLWNIFSA